MEKGWRLNKNGNWQKKASKRTIVVFKMRGRWKFVVNPAGRFSDGSYVTKLDAQAAAYDLIYADLLMKCSDPRRHQRI
jgi:hypothetical protein